METKQEKHLIYSPKCSIPIEQSNLNIIIFLVTFNDMSMIWSILNFDYKHWT